MYKFTYILLLSFSCTIPIAAHGQNDHPSTAAKNVVSNALPADGSPPEVSATDIHRVEAAPVVEAPPIVKENTVAQCSDKKDNDNDSHVDCADQDCGIFAICVDSAVKKASPSAEINTPSTTPTAPPAEVLVKRPFSIGFVPGLSTDSGAQGEVLNHFSLNLIGWQDHLQGAEFSLLGAIRKGNVDGFQGSHLFNVTVGDLRGFQGSSLVNVTGGTMNGLQGSGLVNVSGAGGKGVQASGIANIAGGDFKGLQLSLVNFGTHVTGAQVGLINIASKSMKGASIGLINYAGDGMFAPTVWVSPASMLNLGLKMGSRNFYSLLGAGVHPIGNDRRTSVAFGLGVHGDLTNRLWLEFDLMHNHLYDQKMDWHSNDVDLVEQARLNLGFRFANEFSVYAGPTLDVLVSEIRDETGFGTFYTHTDQSSDTTVSISLGLTAGIQWEPKIGNLNSH